MAFVPVAVIGSLKLLAIGKVEQSLLLLVLNTSLLAILISEIIGFAIGLRGPRFSRRGRSPPGSTIRL